MFRSEFDSALLLAAISMYLQAFALAQSPARDAPLPGAGPEITVMADAAEGVALFGKAKLSKATGKPEELKALGMEGQPLIGLSGWSKPQPDESRVEITPTLPKDGYYDVYVRWFTPGYSGGCVKGQPIKVVFDKGERTLRFDQQMGNVWVFLGSFPFKAGTTGKVSVEAKGMHGASNINGVKFVPLASPPVARPKALPLPKGAPDDFDKLRLHLAETLTASCSADVSDPILAEKIAQREAETYFHWKTLKRQDEIPNLWTVPPIAKVGGGWPLSVQYERLFRMACAYVGSNGPLGFADKMQGNPALLKDIQDGLVFLHQTRYDEKTVNRLGAEWISNEILNPLHISRTIALLYPHFTKEFIASQTATFEHMAPSPLKMYGGSGNTTGFNRMIACYAFAVRGLIENDAKRIAIARDSAGDEFQLNVRSSPIIRGTKVTLDGFYADGSFIQHINFPYIGIYGGGVLTSFIPLKGLLKGSPWEITDPRSQMLNQMVTLGLAPLYFNGDIMYGSLGRSTGQSWHQNGVVSSQLIDATAQLVPSANDADQKELKSILKTWLVDKEKSAFPEFNQLKYDRIGLDAYAVLNQIRNDSSIPLKRPKPGTTYFYNTDYLVHHQPDFAAQLRMFSTRIRTHEDINNTTNKFGWYQGQGALFVYNRDNSRYQDHFWATVDPHRLPGTTVDSRRRDGDVSKDGELSLSPWAGGAELDGYSVASMGLMADGSSLTAQKSWFFLDDQIVCLGNEIKSTDDRAIETIVENTKLHGDGRNRLTINGDVQPDTAGWTSDVANTRWIHLAGTVPGSDLAWVFPQPASLKAVREARKGNWVKSYRNDTDTADHERNYLTLWYDHGKNPTAGSYAYIVLPGKTAEQAKAYADKPAAEILANSANVQAVRFAGKGTVAASVWTDAATAVGDFTVAGKSNVVVIDSGTQIRVALSDPTQLQTGPIRVAFKEKVSKAESIDDGVTVESLNPLTLSIDVTKSDGRPYRATFAK